MATRHLLESGPGQVLRGDLQCGDLEWERGKAWAFEESMGLDWYSTLSNPAMSQMGRRTLRRIMTRTSPEPGNRTPSSTLICRKERVSARIFMHRLTCYSRATNLMTPAGHSVPARCGPDASENGV